MSTLSISRPLRFNTPEFYFHYIMIAIGLYMLTTTTLQLSRPSAPDYRYIKPRLSKGWMADKIDNTDAQYAGFRGKLPLLTILFTLYPIPAKIIPKYKKQYTLIFALVFLMVMNGTSIIFIIAILSINYHIAKILRGKVGNAIATWCFACLILYANAAYSGYKFGSIHSSMHVLVSTGSDIDSAHSLKTHLLCILPTEYYVPLKVLQPRTR